MMSEIRLYAPADWPAVWRILQPIFRAGETYAIETDIAESAARQYWIDGPAATFVACDDEGAVVGSYFLKPNQRGPGAHVCNCGYAVAEEARGKGIAARMCEASQMEAVARGFLAMQFNLVVATNHGAVRLWQKLGFAIVGRLPRAYQHRELGLVDALVMHKELAPRKVPAT